jgi:Uma2 family endonuclease
MSAQPKLFISQEEYLRSERLAEYKSEYYQGEVFPMNLRNDNDSNSNSDTEITLAGAREAHSAINANVIASLVVGLRGRKCTVYKSDLRIHIPANSLYTYPDASVVCGKAEMLDGHFHTLLNPMLIVEVLSDSTEDYDRNGKFRLYRSIPSLREYVLVSQKAYHITSYFLNDSNEWVYTDAEGVDASLQLPSLEIAIALADAYANVELQPPLNHIQA